jgi:hypothetical protein
MGVFNAARQGIHAARSETITTPGTSKSDHTKGNRYGNTQPTKAALSEATE